MIKITRSIDKKNISIMQNNHMVIDMDEKCNISIQVETYDSLYDVVDFLINFATSHKICFIPCDEEFVKWVRQFLLDFPNILYDFTIYISDEKYENIVLVDLYNNFMLRDYKICLIPK